MDNTDKKLLIIEDDPYIINLYKRLFDLENFATKIAENGKAGLEVVKTYRPDLILLDIMMPVMNGMEVLQALKSDEETKAIPVVMLTNLNEDNIVQSAMKLGASDYILKSNFESDYIIGIVAKYIS